MTKRTFIYLEDVIAAKARTDGVKKIKWSLAEESTEFEFKWHTFYRPLLIKLMSLCAAALSLLSYLGIVGSMTGYHSRVSVYSQTVHQRDTTAAGAVIIVLIGISYSYVCTYSSYLDVPSPLFPSTDLFVDGRAYVTMWSVFQMRIANFMELLPGRLTPPKSLSFNSR